jgi:glycosyltransferase involved in cell wall biosynthesis
MHVSVVIPTYNRGYIIESAIRSVFKQNYDDYEIIIVDDGSNDNTTEIIKEINSDKIRLLKHERNRGCSAAYNTGIRESRGHIIAFLDSDDTWENSYLSRQVDLLTRSRAVASFTDTKIVGKRLGWDYAPGKSDKIEIRSLIRTMKSFPIKIGSVADGSEHVIDQRNMRICLLREVPVKPSATVALRSSIIQAGCFDESAPSGTDWALFLKMARYGGFGYIDLPLVTQNRAADATHLKHRERDQEFVIKFLKEERSMTIGDREIIEILDASIRLRYKVLAGFYVETGQINKAIYVYFAWLQDMREIKPAFMMPFALLPLPARRFFRNLLAVGK